MMMIYDRTNHHEKKAGGSTYRWIGREIGRRGNGWPDQRPCDLDFRHNRDLESHVRRPWNRQCPCDL
eukprot:scaffold36524_cov35-Attheya_sp.AAC.2